VILLAACNDNGGGSTGQSGVRCTQDNAADLVGPVATMIDFLPGLSQAVGAAIAKADALSGPSVPAGIIDLGDLGMCSTGQATATWNDADDSADLSPGDIVNLQVTDCDGEVTGSLAMVILSSGTDAGSADLDLNLTITDEVEGATQALNLSGKFRLVVEGSNPPGGMVYRYFIPENTNGGLGIKALLDGQTDFEMGCFNFAFVFSLADGSYSLSDPVADLKIPGEGILSFSAWGTGPLAFTDNQPQSGQLSFWAEAGSLPCARLGIPSNGVDANDSHCVLTATGGGNLTLEGETADHQAFSVQTTWDAIR